MENRYLYRAKRIDNGEWVKGAVLFHDDDMATIFNQHPADGSLQGFEVDINTICQCTGLKDKNVELIWENDICRYYNSEDGDGIGIIKNGYVLWKKGTISVKHKMTPLFYMKCHDEWEVIGNIFDNPELLEV